VARRVLVYAHCDFSALLHFSERGVVCGSGALAYSSYRNENHREGDVNDT
jgi:hypothetical protein